jgi:hypothetical protein
VSSYSTLMPRILLSAIIFSPVTPTLYSQTRLREFHGHLLIIMLMQTCEEERWHCCWCAAVNRRVAGSQHQRRPQRSGTFFALRHSPRSAFFVFGFIVSMMFHGSLLRLIVMFTSFHLPHSPRRPSGCQLWYGAGWLLCACSPFWSPSLLGPSSTAAR